MGQVAEAAVEARFDGWARCSVLKPGDVLVLRSPQKVGAMEAAHIKAVIAAAIGVEHPVLVLDSGMTFGVCTPAPVERGALASAAAGKAEYLLTTRVADGVYEVDRWVPKLRIRPVYLADPSSPGLIQATITIRASGQVRQYRVVEWRDEDGDLIAVDMGGSDAGG